MQNEPDIIFPITMTFKELSTQEEDAGKAIVNAAYLVHKILGQDFLKKFMKLVSHMNLENPVSPLPVKLIFPFDMME